MSSSIKARPITNLWTDKQRYNFQDFENALLKHEGSIKNYPYLDTAGYITTCKGKNIDDYNTFINTNWLYDNRLATEQEKILAYNTLKKMPYGKKYNSDTFQDDTNLRLSEDYCQELYEDDLLKNYIQLQRSIPNYNKMPFPTQLAILETHYNTGSLTDKNKWPSLHKYANEYNQSKVCENLRRSTYDRNGNLISNMPQRNAWAYDYCMKEPFEP